MMFDITAALYVDEYLALGDTGEIVLQDAKGSRVRLVLQERPKERE